MTVGEKQNKMTYKKEEKALPALRTYITFLIKSLQTALGWLESGNKWPAVVSSVRVMDGIISSFFTGIIFRQRSSFIRTCRGSSWRRFVLLGGGYRTWGLWDMQNCLIIKFPRNGVYFHISKGVSGLGGGGGGGGNYVPATTTSLGHLETFSDRLTRRLTAVWANWRQITSHWLVLLRDDYDYGCSCYPRLCCGFRELPQNSPQERDYSVVSNLGE